MMPPLLRALVSLSVIIVACGFSLVAQNGKPRDCGDSFGGFDTRLTVELVGVLPDDAPAVVGFEVTPTGPVMATKTRLYAVTTDGILSLPLDEEIRGISVDAEGRLALQSADGVAYVRATGLERIAPWASTLEGMVVNSGAAAFLEVVSINDSTTFGARMASNDRVLPIAKIDGPVRAAAWDSQGLIAIVGHELIRWQPATNALERLAVDAGLREAAGACSLGATRALVMLRNAALLFSGKSMTVVAAAGGTCRASGQDVFIFDPRLKRLWKIRGIDALGDPARDRAHAERLLQLAVAQDVKFTRTREFSEAVRLIGCTGAHEVAAELQK